jgi:hypothetical protein
MSEAITVPTYVCPICKRANLTAKELEVHLRYYNHPNTPPQQHEPHIEHPSHADGVCPECGCTLIRQEGCIHCHHCGYSKC